MSEPPLSLLRHRWIPLKGIPDGVSYHYTNIGAFQRIMHTRTFLMSNFRDAKDTTELWAFGVYGQILRRILPENIAMSHEPMPKQYFLLCMCLRETNKHLWENYASAPGSTDCSGIAIGIDVEALYNILAGPRNCIHMSSVDYDRTAFTRLCEDSVAGLEPLDFRALQK